MKTKKRYLEEQRNNHHTDKLQSNLRFSQVKELMLLLVSFRHFIEHLIHMFVIKTGLKSL